MSFFIKHREVSGVYLCHEGIHWYWGPRELAKEYTVGMAVDLIRSFPNWGFMLGVDQYDALVEIDHTPATLPP